MSTHIPHVQMLDPFPGRVPWPCGRVPYSRTIRAWYYRKKYWLPRIALWAYVVLPPVLFTCYWTTSLVTAQARLLTQATVLLAAVVLAVLFDLALFAPIFHGRRNAPGIHHAATLATQWRQEWLTLESRRPVLPHVALSLHEARLNPVLNLDASPLFERKSSQQIFEQAVRQGFSNLGIHPFFGAGFTAHHGTLLIVWPLPQPQTLNPTIWLVVNLLNNMRNDSCSIHSGYTYWRSTGSAPGFGYYRGDEATLKYVLPLDVVFSIKGFFALLFALIALIAWPIGMVVLAIHALKEAFTHIRYREFLITADPRYGDSLDLALLCSATQTAPFAFWARPDPFVLEELRSAIRRFEIIIVDALRQSTADGDS